MGKDSIAPTIAEKEGRAAQSSRLSSRFAWGIIAALAGASLWGFSGACAQYLLERFAITPAYITVVRTIVASLCFLTLIFARPALRHDAACLLKVPDARWRYLLFGLGLFGSQFTFAFSVMSTNAGTATVLQSFSTVFVMALACLFGRRLPRLREFVGLLCALAATWLIATGGDASTFILPLPGLIWGFLNASAVTLYLMIPRKLYARYETFSVIGMGMALSCLISAFVWLIGGLWGNPPTLVALDAMGWTVLVIGVGALGTFLAFWLYLYGVSVIGSVKGSLIGVAEPASAMVLAALWLGTAFLWSDWAGLVLMALMIVLVSTSRE